MTIADLVRIASGPIGSGILLALVVLSLLLELQTLTGIAAAVAALALVGFFAAHAAGGADPLVAIVGFTGIALVLGELHVAGGGVLGLLGAIALVLSVVGAFGLGQLSLAVTAIAIAVVVAVVLFVLAVRIAPRGLFARRSIAFESVQGPEYVAAPDLRTFLGHTGMALSYLRPAGVAMVDGRRVDVLTEGEFVPAGSPIVVTRVEGARVFVRPG